MEQSIVFLFSLIGLLCFCLCVFLIFVLIDCFINFFDNATDFIKNVDEYYD